MIQIFRRRRVLLTLAAMLLLVAGSCAILLLPTTTLQGVNYRVTARRIPAYVKTIDFLQRHYQYRILTARICTGNTSDADCVLDIFEWTHTNVRPTPAGWPVVDDHPLNIVIRGYGKGDQMADVFATLTVYAGVPAFFNFIKEPSQGAVLPLAFVNLDGRWIPFDVENHIAFRDRNGGLAGVEELAADPSWVDTVGAGVRPSGLPYSSFISTRTLIPFVVPQPLRSELQQPWPRVRYELRRVLGLEAK